MAPGELRLDLGLRPAQQIEGPVELVLIDRPQTEDGAQRMRRARLAELARGRELGRRLEHTGHHQRQRQRRQPLGPARHQAVETELPGEAEHRGDMTVRQGPLDCQLAARRHHGFALEHPAQRLDLGLGPAREIGERAGPDLATGAVALAQQDRRRRAAVRDARHVHAQTQSRSTAKCKDKSAKHMPTHQLSNRTFL